MGIEVIVLTGFHVGKNTSDRISRLTEYLRNTGKVAVTEFFYHYNTICVNHKQILSNARRLTADTGSDLIVLAFSRGALVAYEAVRRGEKFNTVFLFGGAMDNDLVWPQDSVKSIINIYNPRDLILKAGCLLPNPFKNPIGTSKISSTDPRILNIDASKLHKQKSWINPHSEYFLPANVLVWGDQVLATADAICKHKLEKVEC